MVMDSSKWWWIGNHNTTNFSPWLHSTLSELDEKTKEMLRVIDEDADSFAARAEMYYKKRPELVAMVEDFYRSHRSLAERYDLLRPSSVHKHGSESHHRDEKASTWDQSSWSEACETREEYAESEVDDGEDKWVDDDEGETDDNYGEANGDDGIMKEEIERLREENKVYGEMVREKDEEKREAIRQMSLAIQMLKEENSELKKRCVSSVVDVSQRKQQIWKPFEFKKLEGLFGRVVGNWIVPKTESTTSRELMTL
ncbi:Protein NETWORKED 3A [Raphanus sativus]|uniref:Protein NETWORKED 3A n=1 Tax=Raphanus sativus TaxID=3726 RepID=A0A6J0MD23_RAPSA|nr:protein NETWORKED 3A [Raphanus sativus]XP_018470401.2 protein NETWORKED 3A [Raphanus sativus]XP_018470409.2 protein NETWORKED 3A [Raphanus sativus]XP_018470415.2 protein NETWORKED 3A [Raphanus sativus]XP_056852685.1 protein NETWORKED 3A [Raphanus sativus]KAJ4872502.1 Protein NETWORKED 3A [Raphanus sativus]